MKKILLIALLLTTPFIGFSQTTKPIDSFLGIKFGTPKAAVLAAIRAKGGKLQKESTANVLAFSNVHLGHREAEIFIVRFVDNKAFEADFTFTPQDNNHVMEYYDGVVSDISDIYGKGEATRKFTSPYVDGDGHVINALLVGAAEISTIWQSANSNAINISIDKDQDTAALEIELVYQDDALTTLALSKEKAKDKGDF